MWAGTWSVGGVLVVSHAFGNRLLKHFVVAEPEIQEEIIKDDVTIYIQCKSTPVGNSGPSNLHKV
jgi:protein phosphatase 1L